MIAESQIVWGPEGPPPHHDGCEIDEIHAALITWVRQIRGAVLTGAYEVERNLAGFVEFYLLGPRAADKRIRAIFEEEVLGPLSFERRINLAMRVALELLPETEVAPLRARLNEFKTLRNAMAHNPCWFDPVLDHEKRVLRLEPKIKKGKQDLTLNEKWGQKMSQEIVALLAETTRLVHLVLDPARAIADGVDSGPASSKDASSK